MIFTSVRINGCGILDVLTFSPTQPLAELQQQDLIDFGKLICSIASAADCSDPNGVILAKGIEYIQLFFSRELNNVIEYLLRPEADETSSSTIDGLLQMIWSKTLDEVTSVFK